MHWLLMAALVFGTAASAHAESSFALDEQRTLSSVSAGNSGLSATRFGAFSPALAVDPSSRLGLIVWSADDASFMKGDDEDDDPNACTSNNESEKDRSKCLVDNEFEIFGVIRDTFNEELIIAPFRISVMGDDSETDAEERARYQARTPAVAWNPVSEEFLVVWRADDDTAPLVDDEFEIFGQRVNRKGELLGERIRISVMGDDEETDPAERRKFGAFEPAVAVEPVTGDYLVVWRGDHDAAPLVDNEFEIFGRVLSRQGVVQGEQFRISTMGDDSETSAGERRKYGAYRPSLAHNPVSGNFVVVWQGDDNRDGLVNNEHEIFAQQVNPLGSLVGARVRVSNMGPDGNPDFDALAPAIAVDPETGTHLVVWHGDTLSGVLVEDEFEVFGRLLDADLNFLNETRRISIMGSDSESDPEERRKYRGEFADVAWRSKEQEFLVVWHGDSATPPLVDNEYEVFGRFVKRDGSMPHGRFRISIQGNDKEEDPAERVKHVAERPALADGAGGFFVTWSGGKDGNQQIRARRAASKHAVLALRVERAKDFFTVPEPIVFKLELFNVGQETADDVEIVVTQTEDFPMLFRGCKNVRNGNVCELGDVPADSKIDLELELGTEHLRLGDPQRSLVTLRTLSSTALSAPAAARKLDELAAVTLTEKGGSGAMQWPWLLALLGFAFLSGGRRR